MHFALPQRKSSVRPPPTYAIRPNGARRTRPAFVILTIVGILSALWLLAKTLGTTRIPSTIKPTAGMGGPRSAEVVLVTVFDETTDAPIQEFVKKNRMNYAEKHGYATYFPVAQNYTLRPSPWSWSKVPALRQAMTLYPDATYFFHLDPHVLIMNHAYTVESHIMDKKRLESLMIVDTPIVPPDSVIKTYAGLKGNSVDFVITQDKDGLSEKSFILRRGEWAKFFLDVWFDPLYRTYNFQRAERHALEHIVQWHGTVLAKLALVPQNIMNSYDEVQASLAGKSGIYKKGDFILNFGDCNGKDRNCLTEMRPHFLQSLQQLT